MIAEAIEGSITNTYLKKTRLHWGENKWADDGCLISNNGPTMIYLLFKNIKPAIRIGVSNINDEIEKSTLAKFWNNVKDLLCDISSNYSIIIDRLERYEDYVRHIFRYLLSGPN